MHRGNSQQVYELLPALGSSGHAEAKVDIGRACLQTPASLSSYVRSSVFLPSLSLSLLYLTVLSFNGQMVTYLLSNGYTPTAIGLVRTISVAVEISATIVASSVMKRLGPVRAGLWFLSYQTLCLLSAVVMFWTISNSLLASSILVLGVTLSRLGLWCFDLCAQIIIQDGVGSADRGSFSSTEAAAQNFFEMLSFASTMIFADPELFKYPAAMSVTAVACAGGCYAFFVRRRRGHLLHLSSCIEGEKAEARQEPDGDWLEMDET